MTPGSPRPARQLCRVNDDESSPGSPKGLQQPAAGGQCLTAAKSEASRESHGIDSCSTCTTPQGVEHASTRPGTVTRRSARVESIRTVLPNALHRRGALEKSFQRARAATVEGDYFEFGLYRGSAFAHAVRVARRHLPASPMRFFGFDSFQGLPPLTGVDRTTGEFSQGQFACALDDVRAKLDGKVDWSRVHLVEGWFEDSLTQELKDRLRPAPVAVALIDCDLYRVDPVRPGVLGGPPAGGVHAALR